MRSRSPGAATSPGREGAPVLPDGRGFRQPAYRGIPRRVVGDLRNTDLVMTNTFFVGVYPGLTDPMVDYVLEQFHEAARSK